MTFSQCFQWAERQPAVPRKAGLHQAQQLPCPEHEPVNWRAAPTHTRSRGISITQYREVGGSQKKADSPIIKTL